MVDPRSSDSDSGRTDDREKHVLELLCERDRQVTVGELADAVAGDDDADPYDVIHEDLFERVLPSLKEADEIRFDESRGVVSLSREGWLPYPVSTARRRWILLGAFALVIGASLVVLL